MTGGFIVSGENSISLLIGSGADSDVYEYGEGKVCKLYKPEAGEMWSTNTTK